MTYTVKIIIFKIVKFKILAYDTQVLIVCYIIKINSFKCA